MVAAISAAIRKVTPDCFIIVDGIQHAAHGLIDIKSYDVRVQNALTLVEKQKREEERLLAVVSK